MDRPIKDIAQRGPLSRWEGPPFYVGLPYNNSKLHNFSNSNELAEGNTRKIKTRKNTQ